MAKLNVNPTRMELTRLKKRLQTSTRSHKLLKDKQDELMRQFINLVKYNNNIRKEVEGQLEGSLKDFVMARAVMSSEFLEEAIAYPKEHIKVEVGEKNVMSVNIPEFTAESRTANEGDIFPYGFAFTSFELDDAVMSLNDLLPDLIRLAEIEKSCELMSAEIEKTRRRVNSLEHVMIPRYQETIKYIAMKLEENDRSSRTRLMKVKDMLLEKTYNYSSK